MDGVRFGGIEDPVPLLPDLLLGPQHEGDDDEVGADREEEAGGGRDGEEKEYIRGFELPMRRKVLRGNDAAFFLVAYLHLYPQRRLSSLFVNKHKREDQLHAARLRRTCGSDS